MKLNGLDVAVIAVLVAAGWAASNALLRRSLRRALAEKQREREREVGELRAAIESLQAKIDNFGKEPDEPTFMATEFDLETAAAAKETVKEEEITAETMAVISAAVTAFLGKKVRILSAKLLQSPEEVVSAWSQQGRMLVQTSHNLRS